MTPERAGELASEMRNEWMHNGYHDSVGKIAKVILRACAEEREACAKICRSLHSGDAEFPDWSGGFQSGCEDCEEAIRGAK